MPAPDNAKYVVLDYDGTLSQERKLTGTTNQIDIADGGANSTVALLTPQDIHTGASPTFAGLTLNGGLTAGGNLVPDSTANNRDLGSSASQWRDLHLSRNIVFDLAQVATVAVTTPAAARIYTIPDFGGSDEFVGKAATQALTGKTYNGLSLAGTGSLDVAAEKTVDINESLTVNTNPVILNQSLRTTDSPTFAGFGGDINMNSHKIQNLDAPASDNDAARKKYVDDSVYESTIKASRARAYLSASQSVPTVTPTKIALNAEAYDEQGEFDTSVKIGAASTTSANHLVDATLSPFVAGDVGKTVWNTLDNTYATITAFNSTSDVTISANIMTNGEGYKVYFSRFIATKAGYYQVNAATMLETVVDGKRLTTFIYKNGVSVAEGYSMMSVADDYVSSSISDIIYLAVGGYLELWVWHNCGVNRNIGGYSVTTFMSIHKLS